MKPIEITIKDPELLKKYEAKAEYRTPKVKDIILDDDAPVRIHNDLSFKQIVLIPKELKVCCDTCVFHNECYTEEKLLEVKLKYNVQKSYCNLWESESGHTIKPQIQEPESE